MVFPRCQTSMNATLLLQIYFQRVASRFSFMHPKNLNTGAKSLNRPLILSMMTIGCFYHDHDTFRRTHQKSLSSYITRILQAASSKSTTTIDHVQMLVHIAISHGQGLHKDLFLAAMVESAASLQNVTQKNPAFRKREIGLQPQTLGDWIVEEDVRRTAWHTAWLDRIIIDRSRGIGKWE
ncbi:hypothetical protein M427DRAFT_336738 [Gonapodya prolifera JEL478]|uniref:Xylanolytic transcriptional activator regulatory domain-containing protein n=1 Tax=Gonapodya prolifera (strain JEL478) TaxID=1344416 RepID=A0A139AE37_GONPJ|nr:hypothetical protein M427DRAFT_336738 [Gonapodya prolifera JEL478]|eukprot:KXS14683.1 hypothetical protein M427DRAFT_336738 [Gonapodya prolifera JEL478]